MAETDKALGRLEAEAVVKDETILNLQTDLQKANESIATVKKDAVADGAKIATLESDLQTEKARANRAEADSTGFEKRCTKLQADLTEANSKLTTTENAGKKERVVAAIELAIKKGIEPKEFDGHEKDPVAWLAVKWAGNIEALELMANTMIDTDGKSATSSGASTADAADAPMTDERKAELVKLGLDPAKAVENESEIIALEADKKKDE